MQITPITHQLDELESLYTIRERAEVFSFLVQYPFLVPLLLEAYPQIQHYFPNALCSLQLFTDPESPQHRELFLGIGTTLDADDAFSMMRKFDHDWWLEHLKAANRKLVIDVEFR